MATATARFMDARLAVEEQLADLEPISQAELDSVPDYRWKVMVFFEDGDKSWLDAWYCVGLSSDEHVAAGILAKYMERYSHVVEWPSTPYMELVNVKEDCDALEYGWH